MAKLPLYKQIQDHYREQILAGALRHRDRVPSEQEIMDEFHVSKITVKNALTALADEGLITRVQGKGTFVSRPSADAPAGSLSRESDVASRAAEGAIGLIVPTLKTKVIRKLIDGVEYYAKNAGYQMILHITRESSAEETKAIQQLTESGALGMIVFPTEDEKYNESLLRLSLDKFPFVFIDRYLRNIDTYQIVSDNAAGACDAVNMLLDKGHSQIALVSPDNTNSTIEDRTLGFEKAYIDRRSSIDKTLWCHVPLDILRTDDGEPYVLAFLRAHPEVTAVLALSAETAQFTARSLQKLGRENTELISFDDPDLPGVSYISQNEEALAQAAVEQLREQIDGVYTPRRTVLPVELMLYGREEAKR
ncbi:DNA-binding transcriptional regulator, LacI/PurR family [Cohnella sp. OV330]|uniref:GntR family transcriptional regulator n=1 Tax=Cohnella sp. OV330 TaxID=1855288 RepID=UPI0008E455B4|nr:GntR family transcriptional regulator [Cohnella sp. OV330]SFB02985.1 DNA-binding transcriptional regulator, LacI/PurR family [Cohnella sp. OV330]